MTNQEALIYFKRRQAMCIDDRIQEAENIAIECIEKQIPKEAKCHVSGNGWYGWIEFTCPVCGKEFKDSLVCPSCYQRVKPYKEDDNSCKKCNNHDWGDNND